MERYCPITSGSSDCSRNSASRRSFRCRLSSSAIGSSAMAKDSVMVALQIDSSASKVFSNSSLPTGWPFCVAQIAPNVVVDSPTLVFV